MIVPDPADFKLTSRRQMKQPTKDALRWRLALAEARIESLEQELDALYAGSPLAALWFRFWRHFGWT